MTDGWPWGDLPARKYQLIMADPPWRYIVYGENTGTGLQKSAQAHYSVMTLADICAMNPLLLADHDCVLMLWATNPLLDQAFRVMKAWGFEFKTAGSWEKITHTPVKDDEEPKQAFGTGYILRSSNEPYLIGTVGQPKFSRRTRSSFRGLVRGHSRKPLEAYPHAESILKASDVPRVELFSRETASGWDVWGDEAGKFDEGVSK